MANYLIKSICLLALVSTPALANEDEYRVEVIKSEKECRETEMALYSKYKPLVNRGSEATAFVGDNKVVITNGVKPFVERYKMPKIDPKQIGTKSQMVMSDGNTYVSLECSSFRGSENYLFIWTKQQWNNKLAKEKQELQDSIKQREDILKQRGL